MKYLRSLRRWHRRIALISTPAFAVMLLTGLLLSTRGFNPWLQPPLTVEVQPKDASLAISFDKILEVSKSYQEAEISSWADVAQIDIRPKTGVIRVRSKNMYEIQMTGAEGAVIGNGVRRVSWLISLHEGALFGPFVRYLVFTGSAVGILYLMVSGIVLAAAHYLHKRGSK